MLATLFGAHHLVLIHEQRSYVIVRLSLRLSHFLLALLILHRHDAIHMLETSLLLGLDGLDLAHEARDTTVLLRVLNCLVNLIPFLQSRRMSILQPLNLGRLTLATFLEHVLCVTVALALLLDGDRQLLVRQVANPAVLRCKQLEDLVLVAEYGLVEEEIGLVLRQERLQLGEVHILLQCLLGHGLVREVVVLLVRHEVVVHHLPLDSLRIH